MWLRNIFAMITLFILIGPPLLAAPAQAAQDPFPSPSGQQQQLPPPTSPYPDANNPSPYGGGNQPQQPAYQPQQPAYQPQQPSGQPPQQGYQQAPAGGGGASQPLMDVLGQFRLNMNQNVMPMGATYNFGMPDLGVQVNIMSMAQPQAMAAQHKQFLAMVPQMGGRITDQRKISVNGRQAELVAVTMQNPQANQQFLAYNFFLTTANVWVQVMGPAQAQAKVQQAANLILQGLQTR